MDLASFQLFTVYFLVVAWFILKGLEGMVEGLSLVYGSSLVLPSLGGGSTLHHLESIANTAVGRVYPQVIGGGAGYTKVKFLQMVQASVPRTIMFRELRETAVSLAPIRPFVVGGPNLRRDNLFKPGPGIDVFRPSQMVLGKFSVPRCNAFEVERLLTEPITVMDLNQLTRSVNPPT